LPGKPQTGITFGPAIALKVEQHLHSKTVGERADGQTQRKAKEVNQGEQQSLLATEDGSKARGRQIEE
jgi:hypothetical protein